MYTSNSRYYNQNPGGSPNLHGSRDNYYEDNTSEIYVDSTYHGASQHHGNNPPPPPPRVSRLAPPPQPPPPQPSPHTQHRAITPMSIRNGRTPSEYSSVSKAKSKTRGGVVIETMSAPNPCCPDSKGVCCILLLVNLGLLLVTLGFSIVLQLFDPPFVWYCGLLFLIVGFISLIISLIFCMRICAWSRWSSSSYRSNDSIHGGNYSREQDPSELYWTHHWQKRINLPGSTRNTSTPLDQNSDMVFHSNHRAVSSSS